MEKKDNRPFSPYGHLYFLHGLIYFLRDLLYFLRGLLYFLRRLLFRKNPSLLSMNFSGMETDGRSFSVDDG